MKIETVIPTEVSVTVTAISTIIPTLAKSPTLPPTFTPEKPIPTLWAEWQLSNEGDTAAWSPDGKYIVFSDVNLYGFDDQTSMFEINTLQQVWQVNRSSSSLSFSPDGKYLVDASNRIEFLDVATGEITYSYIECERCNIFYHVAFAPAGSSLWVGQYSFYWNSNDLHAKSAIGTWNAETKGLDNIIELEGTINAFEINSDGNLLATAMGLLPDPDTGKRVFLWDLSTKTKRCDFSGENAIFSPVGNHIAIIDRDGKITLSDSVTCQPIKTIYDAGYIDNFTFSPDGRKFAIAGIPWSKIKIFDTATNELLFEIGKLDGARTKFLAFSPDGRFLLAIRFDKMIGSESDIQNMIHVWRLPEANE